MLSIFLYSFVKSKYSRSVKGRMTIKYLEKRGKSICVQKGLIPAVFINLRNVYEKKHPVKIGQIGVEKSLF